MRTLLIEPFGGLAGDMFLAASLDLGDPRFTLDRLRAFVEALLPGQVSLVAKAVTRGPLRATHLDVVTSESAHAQAERPSEPDPQPAELIFHGIEPRPHAPERNLAELLAIAERAPLAPASKERARRILQRIAEAEAGVHGIPVEQVHFHELSAIDTLVDVCGACFALQALEIERVHSTPPYVGGGTIACKHGELPVPAPATLALLAGLPYRSGISGERLTPTGAALLAEFSAREPLGAPFTLERIGYGAGTRAPRDGPPNVVRVQLGAVRTQPLEPGQDGARTPRREAWLLELNLDDATPEEIGYCLERLRAAGALEAWSASIQMKKDRPGAILSALCRAEARAALERAAFDHTPTLGVRWRRVERAELERETIEVELHGARVRVVRRMRGEPLVGALDLSPEYDDLAALARATGRPLRELERAATQAALEKFRGKRT